MVPVIFRAVLKRQYEGLSTFVEMSISERDYSAVSLLRPACEELIWIKYLKHVGLKDANELLRLMAVTEIGRTLEAQLEFAGPEMMKSLGFTPTFLSEQSASVLEAEKRLKALDEWLNWRSKKKGQIPSVFFLAKATNNLELYKFLYHATSKFVHFSVHELMRRVWGKLGALFISLDTYSKYWSAFSLRWGLHLYLETLVEALDWIEPEAGPNLSEARLMETADAMTPPMRPAWRGGGVGKPGGE